MSQQINLYNPIFLKQKKYFSAVTMVQGLGLMVLGALLVYAFASMQAVHLSRQAGEMAKRLEAEQSRLTKAAGEFAPRQKSQQLEGEIARLESQLKARQEVVNILQGGRFGSTAGFSEYLRAFSRQARNGLWLTSFVIQGGGEQLSITGRALQPELIPAYIRQLNREPVMQGKSFAAMEIRLPAAKPAEAAKEAALPRYVEFSLQSAETGAVK